MNHKRRLLIGVGSLVIVAVLFVNWKYPFSYISLNQSINYQTDKKLVQKYETSIERLEKLSSSSSSSKLIKNRTQYILDNFNQKLFTDADGVRIKRAELEQLLADVQEIRNLLIELAFREDYSDLGDSYLQNAIQQSINLEYKILNLISNRFYSKRQIEISIHNIQEEFRSTLGLYNSFFEEYINNQS